MKCDALVAQWQSSRLLSGGLQVRVLPGALVMRSERALVAQRQSIRLLSGWLQVRILPGALVVSQTARARARERNVMERLISLFREPDYDSPPRESEQRPPPPHADEQPLYFKQLLEYLRQRKGRAPEESDELIGV